MGRNKSFIFGMGLLAGVIGGIAAGILYAPKPGEETRKELKDAAVELYEKNSPAINEAKQQAMESVDLMRYKLERQLRKFSNMLKNNKLQKAKELEVSGEDFN
ncbi:MAG: YtxH domain-containing protein [Heliobacteriaceae bacterium]|jgi:gas vesicle protein|nr:YtxH domain-containing protein [Heliobacteriaceae bacterium]